MIKLATLILAIVVAMEISKYLDGKGKKIKDKIIRIKRTIIKWIKKKIAQFKS
jgi:hypothetical protein